MKSISKAVLCFSKGALAIASLLLLTSQVTLAASPKQALVASNPPETNCIPYITCGTSDGVSLESLPGQWTQSSFRNTFGLRNYYLYIPKAYTGRPIPLMVMLHGCMQSAPEFALESGMNWVAERHGFAVLYPEQGFQDNIWRCWNWFKPENQTRSGGELGIVLGMMKDVGRRINIDTHHIYVTGFSSGAAMAANMLACHSDIFAGAGIASGLEFKAATSEIEAHQVMASGSTHDIRQSAVQAVKCTGSRTKMSAVIAIFGTNDTTVNPVNTSRVLQQFTMINDLLDDGQLNQSQNDRVITARDEAVPGGRQFRTEFFGGNGAIHIEKVTVNGMNHAWSGALSPGPYADLTGPNSSEMIWLFLWNYGAI